MPELRKYIKTRLQELIHKGHFPHNFYEEDDFVDDLFISVYENFDSIKSEEEFYMYLFSEMDSLLKRVERTEHNLHQPLEDIETYAKAERDQLREKITAQLDGDIILQQELEDISYASRGDDFKTIFEVTSEKAVVDHLDNELTHSLTRKQVDKMIANLPLFARNIATLYIHFHLTVPEILKITKEPQEKVQQALDIIKKILQTSLLNM
jgi:DNA-directed RNA polymerase specialized sigma24 family protein